ncbi:SAM-dependent methyltransferase [Streptomyces sp. P1-3]|uniref:SAM-dependent methyltransferase n=1 Tax=Streptomyces sp. P1-3 TaxID=3421658 RepID=UPI003D36B95A
MPKQRRVPHGEGPDVSAGELRGVPQESTVLDLGSGYGGPTRYLAERFGCRVIALNLSEAQNQRHRATNAKRGLDGLIEVVTGSFQDIPCKDRRFDVVWSQEAFCRSGDRARVLSEAVRVLKPEGALVFTDLMAAEDTPAEVLRPAVSRLGVDALATPDFYRRTLTGLGLSRIDFDDQSSQLVRHYVRLTEETHQREKELRGIISPAYLDRLLGNLPLWVAAAARPRRPAGARPAPTRSLSWNEAPEYARTDRCTARALRPPRSPQDRGRLPWGR